MSRFSSLVIAFATIALVVVTYMHINEAKNMRKTTEKMAIETKRLADISIEQFKIKSYPTILITTKEYSPESYKIIQKFGFLNKGEISAFNFSALMINAYKKNDISTSIALNFIESLGGYYEIDGAKITLLDFETKIPKDTKFTLTTEHKLIPPFRVIHPIYTLIIFRFKVPYDTYQYETYSFILEKEKKWERMNNEDTNELLDKYFKIVKNEKALKFLSYNEYFLYYRTGRCRTDNFYIYKSL